MKTLSFPFGSIQQARFVERPNRFVVRCALDNGKSVRAFLPNPGRLSELLLPDVTLSLISDESSRSAAAATRKTQHTVVAVERDGEPVFLHTHQTNRVAERLIEQRLIPGLEDTDLVRSEVPVGHSRFDFLLRRGRKDVYLEVKSCTLFGNGVAMFPDAVTERGRRHLIELASMKRRNVQTAVLFLVQTPRVRWFMPDYHTDLAFSQTLLDVRRRLQILPIAVQWTPELTLSTQVKPVEIPWDFLRREAKDRGSYLLILRLKRSKSTTVGKLGRLSFRSGYYVYVGSAMRNLTARLARHSRLRKKLHWHVDFLRQVADECTPLPIRSSARDECTLASALSECLAPGPVHFGSSDCYCDTHLFWSGTDPLSSASFHSLLQQFRMRHPDGHSG